MPFTDDIILGARQLDNPDGIAPRMDTEGPPPTRMPQGVKLQPIPTHSDAKMNVDNVDPAHMMEKPDMMREASVHEGAPMRDFGASPSPDTTGLNGAHPTTQNNPAASGRIAPHMQASPTLAPPSLERYQNTLKNFADIRNVLSAQKLALDTNDPDMLHKLANIHAQEGTVKNEEANYKEGHPWGSIESPHPGFFGKLGHAFGQIGNVAGEALAPGLAEAIPGSHANLEMEKAQGDQAIGEAVKEQGTLAGAEAHQAGADLSHAKEQVQPTIAQKNVAEAGKADAQTNVIDAVGGNKLEKMSDNSVIQVAPDGTVKKVYQGDPKVKTSFQTLEIDGKPHRVLADANTGQMIHDLGEAPQASGADKGMTMIVPNAQGSGDAVRVTPGTKGIPLGAQTPSGFGDLGRPTQQQRNAAGRATNAVEAIPGIISEINILTPKIGPIAGRWNDFIQGKVGMDDPDFAGLHQDLMMLSSAVALAHAVGRLPENLRLEFDHAINAPKQDPKNLVAVLTKVQTWMGRMRDQGIDPFTKAAEASGAKPAPGSGGGGFADWKKNQGAK